MTGVLIVLGALAAAAVYGAAREGLAILSEARARRKGRHDWPW